MTNKKPEPNPIEKAIGDRTKTTKDVPPIAKTEAFKQLANQPEQIPDVPSPKEMQTLEELNRQTVERLQDQYPEEPIAVIHPQKPPTVVHPASKIPVSKPVLPPATKTSTPESPPQKINAGVSAIMKKATMEDLPALPAERAGPLQEHTQEEADEAQKAIDELTLPKGSKITPCDCPQNHDESIVHIETPAEDIELTNLKKYILEDGFVVATVAFHIVSLCAEPLMTPSTTMWDFKDRANIPDMVFALLNQPGYLEGIWPSLKIVMGSNAGNSAWSAGISTTIAFFDVVRTLPALKELGKVDVAC